MSPSKCPNVPGRPVRGRCRALATALLLGLAPGLLAFATSASAQPPGPEILTTTPDRPMELWDAADYLMRTGQAKAAVPFLKRFLATNPDDQALVSIREKFGMRSVLRLQDDPATRDMTEPMLAKFVEASRRLATNPERIARSVAALTKSREEQDLGVEALRQAGPYAVPPLVKALEAQEGSPEAHALLVRNLGRLDTPAVPPLIATLDAPKAMLAVDAADALARLGDTRALTALAAATTGPAADAARRAIETLTGRPASAQPKSPVRLLADEARRYHTHQIKFPSDPVIMWAWDPAEGAPVPKTVPRAEAETALGLKYARAALALDPSDRAAQTTLLGLLIESAVARTGFAKYPAGDPDNTFASAVAAGPAVLTDLLRAAIADGKGELASVAATALGKVTDAGSLAADGPVNPLVEALSAPDRRARFAAAKALVSIDPARPFAGSSVVVPTLAQFLGARHVPRAVVIDGNLNRGNMVAGQLRELGYDTAVARAGDEGFRAAAEGADTEMVLLDNHLTEGNWRVHDTLANLRADIRTRNLAIYIYSTLNQQIELASLQERFPGIKLIVTPVDAKALREQLDVVGRPAGLPAEERAQYAAEAAALLAKVASRPNSPFGPDLARVEPSLAVALNVPGTSRSAAAALADVALPDAQRGLADALIDPARPIADRVHTASQLARSVQRFGPLVAADQEAKLLEAFDTATDAALRTALGTVVGAMRPKAGLTGNRLRDLVAPPAAGAPPAVTAPVDNPAPAAAPPSAPEADPKPKTEDQ